MSLQSTVAGKGGRRVKQERITPRYSYQLSSPIKLQPPWWKEREKKQRQSHVATIEQEMGDEELAVGERSKRVTSLQCPGDSAGCSACGQRLLLRTQPSQPLDKPIV